MTIENLESKHTAPGVAEAAGPDWHAWQRSWDAQQAGYMPDREARFTAMLDAVEVACGSSPWVLDLACGTGSITRRLLERLPKATSVAVDLDPALLRIARGTFEGDERVRVVQADLNDPAWTEKLGDQPFDAVLTATALHWLSPDRLRVLYGEIASLLRPGGLFCNADHMPDDGLPGLMGDLVRWNEERSAKLFAAGEAHSWQGWWEHARSAPELADAIAERDRLFGTGGHGDHLPPASVHLGHLREAGFTEVGLIWRGLVDAAFAAVR